VLRFLLWRLLGLLALLAGFTLLSWFLHGGPGRLLRGAAHDRVNLHVATLLVVPARALRSGWSWAPLAGVAPAKVLVALALVGLLVVAGTRGVTRRRRRYLRLRVETFRTDHAGRTDPTASGPTISTSACTERRPRASISTPDGAAASGSTAGWSGESGRRPISRNGKLWRWSRMSSSSSTPRAAMQGTESRATSSTAATPTRIASWSVPAPRGVSSPSRLPLGRLIGALERRAERAERGRLPQAAPPFYAGMAFAFKGRSSRRSGDLTALARAGGVDCRAAPDR
jgi:hypothetical protein